MTSPKVQQAIFDHIKLLLPDEINLADFLSPILNLNKNAVYKRLSGTTAISLDDLVVLSKHFHIPMDEIFYKTSNGIKADFSGFQAKKSSLEYLTNLEFDLLQLTKLTNPSVRYVTIGLPDFYYFFYDELAAFQIFTWERMTWNNAEWQHRNFSLNLPEKDSFLMLTRRLTNVYSQIQVKEFWNEYVLDNFFQQLTYIAESRLYDRSEDIEQLLTCSKELILHLKKIAHAGKRFLPNSSINESSAKVEFYYNETMKNNIMLLIETAETEMVYAVVDNPNFIKTTDPKMIAHVKNTFEKFQKRAIPLCGENGERYRDVYFEKLLSRHAFFADKILNKIAQKY